MVKRNIRFSDKAHYSILVAGDIPLNVMEFLERFYTGTLACKFQNEVTQLEGQIKDQVALSGLLNYLNNLHYIILSVKANDTIKVLPLSSNDK